MILTWANFKSFVVNRGVQIQYLDIDGNYYLKAFDGSFGVDCFLPQLGNDDQTDFETNFKSSANASPMQNITSNSFTAKAMVINGVLKKLYARNTGHQYAVNSGMNMALTYTNTYPWVKMIGMECIGAEVGDYASVKVYDNSGGAYSGVPNALLNQFGYSLNIGPGYYSRLSPFDADVFAGMVFSMDFYSMSAKTIGVNFIMNELKS